MPANAGRPHHTTHRARSSTLSAYAAAAVAAVAFAVAACTATTSTTSTVSPAAATSYVPLPPRTQQLADTMLQHVTGPRGTRLLS
jgi:hypothetical protein